MLGGLAHYVTHAAADDFQPMKANFGIMPPLERKIRDKRARYEAYADRALADLEATIVQTDLLTDLVRSPACTYAP